MCIRCPSLTTLSISQQQSFQNVQRTKSPKKNSQTIILVVRQWRGQCYRWTPNEALKKGKVDNLSTLQDMSVWPELRRLWPAEHAKMACLQGFFLENLEVKSDPILPSSRTGRRRSRGYGIGNSDVSKRGWQTDGGWRKQNPPIT